MVSAHDTSDLRSKRQPRLRGTRAAISKSGATSPDSPNIMRLGKLGRATLAVSGGKGANLGELVRGRFPVPLGFVITTGAYDQFVAENGLGEIISRVLREGQVTGATIRDAFESAPIPEELERNIVRAYRSLGRGPVAVRSSATAEDLPEAAFAGQQDTFLNVVGEEDLLRAVRSCWASLWTDRAISYRERQGIGRATVKLAVVVQRMAQAEAAGVLFTANPVTGVRDEIVIEASPGLGEAVVSGLVTADQFTLKQGFRGWRIVDRQFGRREVIIKARTGGGTERVERPTSNVGQALPDRALLRLAGMGKAIERHFDAPQDVEWAWDGKKFYIVQARPITALPEPPPRPSRPMQLMAGLVAELLPDRPYPLEISTWVPTVYGFIAQFGAVLGLKALPPDQLFVEEDGVVVRLRAHLPARPTLGILLAPVRLLRLARRYNPTQWRADPLLGRAQAQVRRLEARDLRAISWDGLLGMVRETLAIPGLIWKFRIRYLVRPMLALARLRLILALLGRQDLFGTLVFTGIETRTLEANRAIEMLAARVRSDPTLASNFASHEARELGDALEAPANQPSGRALLRELSAFLDEYGHREVGGTMQVSQPTWKEAPEVVLSMLQGIARSEPRPHPQKQPSWEVARAEALTHPLMRLRPLRSIFLKLLDEARYFPQLREDTRFYFTLPLPILRRSLLELGRRLTEVGVLDIPDEVFHLKLDELEQIRGAWQPPADLVTELKSIVVRRKAKRIELEGTPLVDPRLFRNLEQGEPEGDILVLGIPGSPGLAEGPVRVIHESSQFGNLHLGDILVAPFTNPAWTPLFERASAVVVDSGGPLSHAAIVAREYGIPAVMGTVDGTRRVRDGLRVRVDGIRGTVSEAESSVTRQES